MWQRLIRFLKHRLLGDLARDSLVAKSVLARLATAVDQSEATHRGEIRIFIETSLPNGYLWSTIPTTQLVRQRAVNMFGKLRVWDTEDNSGVLIYLLLAEKRLEIVADRGLDSRVPSDTWSNLSLDMSSAFKAGDYELGLMVAIDKLTKLLQLHFPLVAGQSNPNELPNEPLLG